MTPKNFLAGAPHEFLALADFNGDSLPDLATEAVKVFLNSCSSSISAALPTLTISDVSLGESPTDAVFEVSLSSASSQTVSVSYQTIGQSAVSGTDFQVRSGTLSFAPGETLKTVAVPVLDDSLDEFNETFFLSLHHPVNAAIKRGQGIGSIVDTDPVPSVRLNSFSVLLMEGNSGSAQANFGVALSSPSGKLIQMKYSTADISATAGSDYQAASNVGLKIGAGSTAASFFIPVHGDTEIEPDETFSVSILDPVNANTAGAHATVTIVDDDATADLKLLLEESGPDFIQAAALDSLLFTRDPFRVLSRAEFWDLGADRNTRVIVFVADLTFNAGETASAVTVALIGSNGQTHDIGAEDVRAVPDFNFTQVMFRLPNGLPVGPCLIRIKAHGQTSNAGTIRITS